jgi:putative transposase
LTTKALLAILPGMARKLRVEYAGAIYHVMNRGDRREPIFRDDEDRTRFLSTLGEVCAKAGWQVLAYCLMGNHFHLVVETPEPNLVSGMKWFLGTYTTRFNRRHKLIGHLFSGRYKALVVDGSGNGYLKTVCDYVHLNPARAKLLAPEQPLRSFGWSSWPEYLKPSKKRMAWLRVERLLGEYRIPKDSRAGRQQLQAALEARRQAEASADYRSIRRGWCLGDEAFRKELLAQVGHSLGQNHFGPERAESQVEKAERVVREELRRRGWNDDDLSRSKKGDLSKVRVAQRLREETMVTLAWIVQRLKMGSVGYLNNRLYLLRQGMLK